MKNTFRDKDTFVKVVDKHLKQIIHKILIIKMDRKIQSLFFYSISLASKIFVFFSDIIKNKNKKLNHLFEISFCFYRTLLL